MTRVALLILIAASTAAAQSEDRARKLHEEVPLVDGHNDLPWQYREKVKRKFSELDGTR